VSPEESRRLTRRAVLTAAVAGTASLAGCPIGSSPDSEGPAAPTVTDQPADPVETPESRFQTTVDMAAAGAATDGSASITDLVTEHAADDTALVFSDGRYVIEPILLSDLQNFAMMAAPNANPVFVPAGPVSELGKWVLQLTSVDRLLLEGITFDFSKPDHGGMTYVLGTGDFTVRNVRVDGPMPRDTSAFRFEVVERDSRGLVENLVLKDGSVPESTSVGIYVGSDHAGTLTFRNCEVENFPNNGLYASSPGREDALAGANGPVQVEGGRYRNNNVANVRLGSNGSYVKNAEIVIDEVPPPINGEINARGIRFRARGGHLVEDCDVRIDHPDVSSLGGIVVHRASRNVRVRNTSISIESQSVPAINVLEPDNGSSSSSFENVEISGAASDGDAVRIIERDGTTFQGCTIEQPGENRNGLRFERSDQCHVQGCSVSATAEPLVAIDSSVSTHDTRLRDLDDVRGDGSLEAGVL